MRLIALFAFLAFVALLVQTAIPHLISSHILVPNLIVILAVDLGFRHHGALSALLAFAMGYAADAFSGAHLGVNAFLITLVFLLTYEISRRLLVTNSLVGAVAVFLAVLVASVGNLMLSSGAEGMSQAVSVMPWLLLQALLTAIIAPAVFSVLARCKRVVGLPARAARE